MPTVVTAAEDDGIALREEGPEANEAAVWGLPPVSIVSRGQNWALMNLRAQMNAVASRAKTWGELANECTGTHLEAIAEFAASLPPNEQATASLNRFVLEVAAVIATRWDSGLPPRLGFGSDEFPDVLAKFPFLFWGRQNSVYVSASVKEMLDLAAATRGGPWLMLASEDAIGELAQEDPGGALGELAELGKSLELVDFETKVDGKNLKMLQAFFRSA